MKMGEKGGREKVDRPRLGRDDELSQFGVTMSSAKLPKASKKHD